MRGATPEPSPWTSPPDRGAPFPGCPILGLSEGDDVVPWVTLSAQAAVAVVIIPVTLRRYRGVIAS